MHLLIILNLFLLLIIRELVDKL